MRRQRRWSALLALILCAKLQFTAALPVPEDETDTSSRLLGSSVVTSVSVITGEGEDARQSDSRKSSSSYELPHSPAGFFTPDRFQFYTYNDRGDMITRQMTEQEIQSLIAAGGGHSPMDEPQKADDVLTGGKKVADVVEKVQNVLKSAMDKPTTVMSSVPTIPGHANDDWSSILPAILAGEAPPEPANIPETQPETATTQSQKNSSPSGDKTPENASTEKLETSEKPMIPVPVITIDQKQTTQKPVIEDSPMFQILNFILAENASKQDEESLKATGKPPVSTVFADIVQEIPTIVPQGVGLQTSGAMEPSELVHLQIIADDSGENENKEKYSTTVASNAQEESSTSVTMSVISETHSTSMKVPGLPEMPLHVSEVAGMKQETVEKPAEIPENVPSTSVAQIEMVQKQEDASTSTEKTIGSTGSDDQKEIKDQAITETLNLKNPSSTEPLSTTLDSNSSTERTNLVTIDGTKLAEANNDKLSTASPVSMTETPENNLENVEPLPPNVDAAEEKLAVSSMTTEESLPEKKPDGISSETSAIEQIIETLNQKVQEKPDLTTIKTETMTDSADLSSDKKTESQTILAEVLPTVAAPIKVDTQPEMPGKPMANLPTELANSLSSMINQISDAFPSILPVSPSGNPDGSMTKADDYVEHKATTLKPTTLKAIDEPIVQMMKDSPLSSGLEEPTIKVELPLKTETQKVSEVSTGSVTDAPERSTIETEKQEEDTEVKIENVTVETVKEIPENSTARIELVNSTTEVADSMETKNEPPQKADQAETNPDSPVINSSENKSTSSEAKQETTTVSGIVADNVESQTKPEVPEDLSYVDSNLSSTTQNVGSATTNIPYGDSANGKNQSVLSLEMNDEGNKEDVKIKVQSAEDVKVQFPSEPSTGNVVQTQFVAIVDDMLQTAEVPSSTPAVEAISLPANMDKVNINNLASSLIAGFPSTTQNPDVKISATNVPELSSTVNTKVEEPVEIPAAIESVETVKDSTNPVTQQEIKTEGPEVFSTTMPTVKEVEGDSPQSEKLENATEGKIVEVTTQSEENEDVVVDNTTVEQPVEDVVSSSTVAPQEKLSTNEAASKLPTSEEMKLSTMVNTDIPASTSQTIISAVKEAESTTVRNTVSDLNAVTENASGSTKISIDNEPAEETKEGTKEEVKLGEVVQQNDVNEKEKNDEESLKDKEKGDKNTSIDESSMLNDESSVKKENVPVFESSEGSTLTDKAEVSANSTKLDNIVPPKEIDSKTEEQKVTKDPSKQEIISAEDSESTEAKKPAKPEIPVVRIDISPEMIQQQLPAKIQLTDLPILEKISFKNPPEVVEKSDTPNDNASETASTEKIESQETSTIFNNNDEIMGSMTGESPVKLEAPLTRVELLTRPETNVENSEKDVKNAESSTLKSPTTLVEIVQPPRTTETVKPLEEASTESNFNKQQIAADDQQQKIQEIRIQVNDTAVLVTKHPLAELVPTKHDEKKPSESVEVPLVKFKDEEQNLKKETTEEIEKITSPALIKIPAETVKPPENLPVTERIELVTMKTSNKNENDDVKIVEEVKEDPTYVKIPPLENSMKNEQLDEKISSEEKGTSETVVKGDNVKEELSLTEKPVRNKVSNEDLLIATTLKPQAINVNKQTDKPLSESTTLPATLTTKTSTIAEELPSPLQMQQSLPEKLRPDEKVPAIGLKKPTIEVSTEQKWALIPQQIPTLGNSAKKPPKRPSESTSTTTPRYPEEPDQKPVDLMASQTALGLDASIRDTSNDIINFSRLCNELAFSFWMATNKGLSTARSLALSPFGMTSLLAMIFLGARGPTSEQMNEILRLDDVATFNPHLVFQNVTDAVGLARNQGIANAAFVRELFADKSKVRKLMPFYKDQAQQFYEGLVAEVNFAAISDLVRRRTNLLIRKQTGGRIKDFVKTNTVPLRSPLAAMSANVFQTDCNSSTASSEGRDGELYFAVSPAVRQRKLVPVPATVWRSGVLAGYEPSLDATAVALGGTEKLVSTIFVIPGQQGHSAPGDTLDRLEQRLVKGAFQDDSWNKLLKVLIPRPGLELQVPKFSHRSVVNATAALKRMGLDELFSKQADLKGINGVANHLHLADVLQMNLFSTCGDENIQSGRHHVEIYPSSSLRNARHFETDEVSVEELEELEETLEKETDEEPEELVEDNFEREKRDASQERPRLKLDRPFLYFVRHNPTGLILHMGRFNPRLLP